MSEIISSGPFAGLPRGAAGALLTDPPWHFKRYSEKPSDKSVGRAPQDHYKTMTQTELRRLPVIELAAPNCILFMWATWPHLRQAVNLIKAWRFTYKTCAFDWMKADVSTLNLFSGPTGADMKMGYWTRSNSEVCLLATRGKPKRLDAGVRMGIIEPSREHSRKPDVVYDRIERLVAGPYVELFARTPRPGWKQWGNDLGKFSPAPASENPSEVCSPALLQEGKS